MSTVRIGFIGLGLMGMPMCQRLLAAGVDLTVWNRSLGKSDTLQQQGAKIASSPSDLAANTDIILLCVTDTAAVEQVIFANQGVVHGAHPGQILVDFSSIDPEHTRSMASRLQAQCQVSWVDAPVSGGVAGAEQGTLAIMAGGSAQDIDHIRPILALLSQRVTRMGDVGAGQTTKICNQMLVSCNVLVMAEVMALAERAGVDASRIPEALKGGFADSIPLQLTGPRMAERDFDIVKWHVKTLLKDLDMAKALAKQQQSAVPMVGLGAELMRLHANQGYADCDPCTLVDLYQTKQRAE